MHAWCQIRCEWSLQKNYSGYLRSIRAGWWRMISDELKSVVPLSQVHLFWLLQLSSFLFPWTLKLTLPLSIPLPLIPGFNTDHQLLHGFKWHSHFSRRVQHNSFFNALPVICVDGNDLQSAVPSSSSLTLTFRTFQIVEIQLHLNLPSHQPLHSFSSDHSSLASAWPMVSTLLPKGPAPLSFFFNASPLCQQQTT